MKKPPRGLVAIAAVVLVAGAIWLYERLHGRADDSVLTLYGNVDIREAQPAFNDTGPVTRMLVVEGARVKRGDLLAEIDDSRYAARLAQARAQAENARAVLDRLEHGSRPEEIAQARATMAGLQALYENDQTLYERTVTLLSQGVATTEDRDNAQAALRSAREAYQAARQNYLLAVKGPRVEDIEAARRAHAAAAAAVAFAEREFADTRLYAPSDGVIEDRILEPGDMASPGTPVYTMAQLEPLWVRAYVPETRLGRIRPGMPAQISTDSFPGRRYPGWVGYLSPTAEFTPKTVESPDLRTRLVYQVRVYACDPRGELRLGMPATVSIDLRPPAAVAPDRAPPSNCGAADADHP